MRLIISVLIGTFVAFADAEAALNRETNDKLYIQGGKYQISQNYEQAYSCYKQALKGYRIIGHVEGEVKVLMQMSQINGYWGKYSDAVVLLKEAYLKLKHTELNNKMLEVLLEQRYFYNLMNEIEAYNRVGLLMDSIVEQIDDEVYKMDYYCKMGDECKQQQDFEIAVYYYEKYIKIAERLDITTQLSARSIYFGKMRDLKVSIEDYKEAVRYGEQQANLYQMMFAKHEPERYMPYMALCNIYGRIGDCVNAERSIDSLNIALKLGINEVRERAWIHRMIGLGYASIKNYMKALDEFREADKILSMKYGKNDRQRISNLLSMAGSLFQLNKYEESRMLYTQYAQLQKKETGEDSNEYAEALYYQANIEAFSENMEYGTQLYSEAVSIYSRNIKSQWQNISSMKRQSYWNSYASIMFGMTAFAQKGGFVNDNFTEQCYNALLLSKALLLSSERSLASIIQTEGSEDDKMYYGQILSLQTKMMELKRNFQQNRDSIIYIHNRIRVLDNILAVRIKTYGNYMSFLNVKYEDIKEGMKESDILVDFIDYFSDEKVHQYAAYIIKKEQKHPLLVNMFTKEEVDNLIENRPMDVLYSDSHSEIVMDLFWNRVKSYAQEGGTVYYVPSGIIHQIAIESLPMNDNVILSDKYNFVRLSSARELLTEEPKLRKAKKAVLYGGLQYNLNDQTMLAENQKYKIPPLYVMRGELRGDRIFRDLPQTLDEVLEIENILKSNGCDVKVHCGINGTEESFVCATGKVPDILHFATHGFYYTPDKAEQISFLQGYTDAMDLSGLVMAGGNTAWSGKSVPKGVLDGILTAQNIANLDLAGVELVGLSACQTGQGKITPEGLFGLQRAFKKAGAKTLLVTLWQVSDKITKEFMIEFYRKLVDTEWDKRKAFKSAKSAIRNKFPNNPFYWSGFVMVD